MHSSESEKIIQLYEATSDDHNNVNGLKCETKEDAHLTNNQLRSSIQNFKQTIEHSSTS